MRLSAMEAALHTTEYICGSLAGLEARDAVRERSTIPIASLANLNRAIVQITLAEDRFDESAEERAARIKAEAEAKARAERGGADGWQPRPSARCGGRRTSGRPRGAIRAITLDYIRMPHAATGRGPVRRPVPTNWEAEDAYDADPAEIVADACAQLALTPRIVPDAELQTPDGKIDPAARKKRLVAFARTYIDLMKPADPAGDQDDAGPADPPVPPAQAQGPPH